MLRAPRSMSGDKQSKHQYISAFMEVKNLQDKIELACLNPQGLVEAPSPSGLTNPRIHDLEGKKIGIFWDGKLGGDNFCIALEDLFKKSYPTVSVMRAAWGDKRAIARARDEVDAFIYAVGDAGMGGWFGSLNVADLERSGKPGVFVLCDNAIHTARMAAESVGMPALRIVSLPSIEYFPNRFSVEGVKPLA